MKLTIGYVGLSHLGINYAAASAVKGFKIVAYDKDIKLISSLKKRKLPFFEKNLKKNLKNKNISFTNKSNDLKKCDIIFISKDIPTSASGKSDLSSINKLIKDVTRKLKKNTCVVILCQVPPGFCEKIKWYKKKLYYQVETLIFSQAQKRALNPERIIIGKFFKSIDKRYLYYLKKFNCPIIKMNIRSAELTKISINMFLISSVTTTNMLSEISERLNADWNLISKSLRLDRRIGKYAYLNPGLGITGGNLERDLETLKRFSNFNNNYRNFRNNLKNISNYRRGWIFRKFQKVFRINKEIKNIGICGLSYKEGTNSVKNSPSIFFIKKILKKKIKINIFDPLIKKIKISKKIKICKSFNNLLKPIDLLIIATPWNKLKNFNINKYRNIKYIIDPYQQLKLSKINNSIKYFTMGKSL